MDGTEIYNRKEKKKRERERKEGIVEIVIKFETNGHTKE